MSDVYQLLDAWGRWSRDKCLPSGVRCGIAIIMDQNVGGVLGFAPVNDDDAMTVEKVMRTMKQRKPDHYEVVYLSYVKGLSTRKIGKVMGKSNGWASDTLRAGEAWVEGALSSYVLIA